VSLVVPFEEIFANEDGLLSRHNSWKRVELGKIASVLNGYAFKSNLFSKTKGFPLIRIRNIATSTTETLYNGDYEQAYVVNKGDLLIGMDGNFQCHKWQGEPSLLNQRVCKITAKDEFLDNQFLYYAINGYLKAIQDATSSVTVGHLSSLDILKIPFPIPPLNEQRRIVEKLDRVLERVESCRARLDGVPKTLKRFRQSVLAAACSGRLTADWRAKNADVEMTRVPSAEIEQEFVIVTGQEEIFRACYGLL